MDVLVIGGSVFVGRAVVDEARAAGHAVTVFNRGTSGPPPPDGVRQLTGDRTDPDDLAPLGDHHYDLVIDTCGYVPVDVRASARAVDAAHYAFVSSINVFPDWPAAPDYHPRGVHDGDPDASRGDVPAELGAAEPYGWLKVGCERAVEREFGVDRTSILRAGALVGPHDGVVARLPWWIDRVARGGEILVPGRPDDVVSFLDSRDLAQFALRRVAGTYETAGPPARDTRGDLMTALRDATGTDAEFTWVDDDWLLAQGVTPWTEVPLWIPSAQAPSVWTYDTSGAEAAGLTWRPLTDTVADTWAWQRDLPGGRQPSEMTPGLDPQRERELLAAWHART